MSESIRGNQRQDDSRVYEYEPNRKLAVKSATGPIPVTVTITFEPTDGGTKILFIGSAQTAGLFKLMDPLLENMFRGQAPINFRRLRELLET